MGCPQTTSLVLFIHCVLIESLEELKSSMWAVAVHNSLLNPVWDWELSPELSHSRGCWGVVLSAEIGMAFQGPLTPHDVGPRIPLAVSGFESLLLGTQSSDFHLDLTHILIHYFSWLSCLSIDKHLWHVCLLVGTRDTRQTNPFSGFGDRDKTSGKEGFRQEIQELLCRRDTSNRTIYRRILPGTEKLSRRKQK